jgi:hypothetical protein
MRTAHSNIIQLYDLQEEVFDAVMKIPDKHLKKSTGADKGGRDAKCSYVSRPDEKMGTTIWARCWKPIAHPVSITF